MRKTFLVIFIALALAGFAQEKSAGQDKTAVMATVHQFVDAFNKGDAKTAAAACADETSIIDEFPPYEWHGAGACTKWMNDYDVWAKKNSMSDGAVTLGSPRHVDVEGDRAYVVIPSDISFKEKGKAAKETGSMFTLVLRKEADAWRIVGWSWAKN
jgi:ketosteroid isomerase-like protein